MNKSLANAVKFYPIKNNNPVDPIFAHQQVIRKCMNVRKYKEKASETIKVDDELNVLALWKFWFLSSCKQLRQ